MYVNPAVMHKFSFGAWSNSHWSRDGLNLLKFLHAVSRLSTIFICCITLLCVGRVATFHPWHNCFSGKWSDMCIWYMQSLHKPYAFRQLSAICVIGGSYGGFLNIKSICYVTGRRCKLCLSFPWPYFWYLWARMSDLLFTFCKLVTQFNYFE